MGIKGRKHRLVIGFIAPPLLGFVLLSLFLFFAAQGEADERFLAGAFLLGLPVTFLAVGLQSLLFSCLMEFLILVKFSSHLVVLCFSLIIGFLSGLFFGLFFAVYGAIVAGIVGLYLFRQHKTVNQHLIKTQN